MNPTRDNEAVIAKVADALFQLEELGNSVSAASELAPSECSRFGRRIHELRARAIGLLEVLTGAPSPGRGH